MLCLLQFIITNKQQTNPTMAQQQLQQQQRQRQPRQTPEERRTTYGKLEIQRVHMPFGRHELSTEIKELIHNLLCQWTRDNYQEIVKILHENNCEEYTLSLHLVEMFSQNIMIHSLYDFILHSGIIRDYRVSIYLYCCDQMIVNVDVIHQRPDNTLDITNNQEMVEKLLRCYYHTDFIMVNEFIEMRDSPILK